MERVVTGMSAFGSIDWYAYYKQPNPQLTSASSPCRNCQNDGHCARAVDPDKSNRCVRWCAWFRQVWPVVAGKKKTAHSGVNTEGG